MTNVPPPPPPPKTQTAPTDVEPENIEHLAKKFSVDCVKRLYDIANSDPMLVSPTSIIAACNAIIERGHGKAVQSVKQEINLKGFVEQIAAARGNALPPPDENEVIDLEPER